MKQRFEMRCRVVSFPEMNRNMSWVRASMSVRRRPSTSVVMRRVMKSSAAPRLAAEADHLVDVR
jgi:hypothetical protein